MSRGSNLTNKTRDVCVALLERLAPGEAQLLDPIWDAFWRSLPEEGVEALREPPSWSRGDGATGAVLAALGDTSHQAMDALYLVGAVVGAVVTLCSRDRSSLIETLDIDAAIRTEVNRIQAPERVRRVLESFATGLLAEQFSAADWTGDPGAPTRAQTGSLWVEWCEPSKEIIDTQSPQSGLKARDDVQREFRGRRNEFALYIDETESTISAAGATVPWRKLQARQSRFLYAILKALRHGTGCFLTYRSIARFISTDGDVDDVAIRRGKSELNKKLNGVINRVLIVQRSMGGYSIETTPYCWIRLDGAMSRLCPDAPA